MKEIHLFIYQTCNYRNVRLLLIRQLTNYSLNTPDKRRPRREISLSFDNWTMQATIHRA